MRLRVAPNRSMGHRRPFRNVSEIQAYITAETAWMANRPLGYKLICWTVNLGFVWYLRNCGKMGVPLVPLIKLQQKSQQRKVQERGLAGLRTCSTDSGARCATKSTHASPLQK